MFRMRLGLDRIGNVLDALGLSTPPFGVAHVVGTNGKGSVAAYTEAVGRAHGLKVGLFTSPHFLDFRERALVQGRVMPKQDWVDAANRVLKAGGGELTYFEFMTAMAVVLYASAGVDLAVMEAGLGGRYDATRVLPADIVLLTRIDMDHMHVLGDSLSAIAADKAGAMRPGVPAVSAVQAPDARVEIEKTAKDLGVDVSFVDASSMPPGLTPGMAGEHQRGNAALALAGWRSLARGRGLELDMAKAAEAISRRRLPGRVQSLGGTPEIIVDCGHNPAGLSAMAATLAELGVKPDAVVFTCMQDKDLDGMARVIRGLGAKLCLAPELPGMERARPAGEVAKALGQSAVAVSTVAEALDRLPQEGTCLICGSLYLLAEFFSLRPDSLFLGD